MALAFCGWHCAFCCVKHAPDNSDEAKPVHTSNAFGLCARHFAAQHGRAPTDVAYPLPGMVQLAQLDQPDDVQGDATAKRKHPLAPKGPFPPPQKPHAIYRRLYKPDLVDQLFNQCVGDLHKTQMASSLRLILRIYADTWGILWRLRTLGSYSSYRESDSIKGRYNTLSKAGS